MAGMTTEQFRKMFPQTGNEPVTGALAQGLQTIAAPLNQYRLPESTPIVGGMSAADFTGLTGAQGVLQDFSKGNLQSGDMRMFDLLGLGAGIVPTAKLAAKGGGLLGREALRQMDQGTGLLGKGTIDPRQYMLKNKELDEAAKKYFGTTFYPQETGYIMDDLSRLDFTGRSQAGGYRNIAGRYIPESGQPDYLKMERSVDHREVNPLLGEGERTGWEGLSKFMDETGAVRYDADAGISLVNTNKPNPAQIEKIVNDFKSRKTPLIIDIDKTTDGRNLASKEFESPTVDQVKRWINKQYKSLL